MSKSTVLLLAVSISFFIIGPTLAKERTISGITEPQADILERLVRNRLKDPYSAKVPVMRAVLGSDGKMHLCGAVNSKNIYGAYSGLRPFYLTFSLLPPTNSPPYIARTALDYDSIIAICDGWDISVRDHVFTFEFQ